MKKYIAILLTFVFALSFCACTPTDEPIQTLAPELTMPPEITFKPAEDNTINGFKIEFMGAELTQDADFNDALRIYIQATNISEETTSLHSNLDFQASQGDLSLNPVSPLSVLRYDGVADLAIRPNTSVRCTEVVALNSLDEAVTVSYHDLFDIDSTFYITETFDLDNLPEKPDPYFVDLVEEPEYAKGLSSAGAIGELGVAIIDSEVIKLMEGNDGIRIYLEVRNNSANSIVFSNELMLNLFQDHVALKSDYPLNDVEADAIFDPEIAPGVSVIFARVFELTSGSPVEVEISSYWAEEKVGGVYPIVLE